jgi:hypothetical protein
MQATTKTMTYRNVEYHPASIIILLVVVLAAAACLYCEHAVKAHGADAVKVRECLENNDPLQQWVSMRDGRVFLVCALEDGRFGIQIRDETEQREITSFIYRASKGMRVRLSQVENYLRNNVGALRVGR